MIGRVLAVGAISCAVIWTPAAAQPVAGVNIEVSECIALQSDRERLDCYERLTEAALSAPANGETSDPSASQVVSTDRPRPETGRAPVMATDPRTPDEILSAISDLDERRPNEYLITLENGQVWRQSIAKRYPLRVGQDVRVYATQWGSSYRLSSVAANGFIQVERVK